MGSSDRARVARPAAVSGSPRTPASVSQVRWGNGALPMSLVMLRTSLPEVRTATARSTKRRETECGLMPAWRTRRLSIWRFVQNNEHFRPQPW